MSQQTKQTLHSVTYWTLLGGIASGAIAWGSITKNIWVFVIAAVLLMLIVICTTIYRMYAKHLEAEVELIKNKPIENEKPKKI